MASLLAGVGQLSQLAELWSDPAGAARRTLHHVVDEGRRRTLADRRPSRRWCGAVAGVSTLPGVARQPAAVPQRVLGACAARDDVVVGSASLAVPGHALLHAPARQRRPARALDDQTGRDVIVTWRAADEPDRRSVARTRENTSFYGSPSPQGPRGRRAPIF